MNYENLFSDMRLKYKLEKEKADRQKARGKHDYNIFTTFFKAYDEVRLHSRFIASMLDPSGDHYKSSLFLDIFVAVCDIAEFGLDATSATVWTEDSHIDIHIFDNQKHIIIENKVYAKDQDRQIQRYVNTLLKDKDIKQENIYVLYLHPDDTMPNEYSLGDYEYCEDKKVLKNKHNNEIKIKPIRYDKEIREWVQKCKQEVANLSDLSSFLSQYESVIDMIYGKYERVDKMSSDILKGILSNKENYIIARNLADNFSTIRWGIIDDFFKKVANKIGRDFYSDQICHQALVINDERWGLFKFVAEFQAPITKFSVLFIGFKKQSSSVDPKQYPQKEGYEKPTEYFSLYKCKKFENDIVESILSEKLNYEDFANEISSIIRDYEGLKR